MNTFKKPNISIIIPIYNDEKFLNRCVDSILSQDYKNFELLLIDDGSTDASPKICDEYQKMDKRVRAFHKENGGQSSARNMGILHSNGDKIIFVDDDDWLPDAAVLSSMYEVGKNSDILICSERVFSTERNKEKFYNLSSQFSARGRVLCALLATNSYTGTVWSKLYSRQLFIDNDIFFVDNLICEDEEITPRLLYYADSVEFLEKKCYQRYCNPNSQTNTFDDATYYRKAKDRIITAGKLYDFFSKEKMAWKMKRIIFGHIVGLYKQGLYFTRQINNAKIEEIEELAAKNNHILDSSITFALFRTWPLLLKTKLFGTKKTLALIRRSKVS